MRKLVVAGLLTAAVVPLAACGGSSSKAASAETAQRNAEMFEIDQIERTWHQAASTHDLDLMMSIWAPDASFTIGGKTVTGKTAIRALLSKAGPFQPQNHWLSDTPAYKIRTTVSGEKGTLYFECHYIDTKTGEVASVVGADQDVEKIDGKWLITNSVAATPRLKP
ncbi:MAG TPA: nuclear transport factor 2 family protein [Gaiellaceae bacterium]|nr:nuclear transport factor 2 family protein [Gaiellaceae bacterium]